MVQVMSRCSRVFASLIAGLATGVLGVTGWGGFVYYFLVHALVWCCEFTANTVYELLTSSRAWDDSHHIRFTAGGTPFVSEGKVPANRIPPVWVSDCMRCWQGMLLNKLWVSEPSTSAFCSCRRSLWVDEVLTSTSLLTFILFWTLTHNFVHLF